MDLYFEVMRGKTHIFCQAKENATILELKKIIEGILKVLPESQTLKKPINEGRTEWLNLDDENQTMSELGFTPKNSKADEPATLALILPQDDNVVYISPLSSPPALPESMRSTRETEFET